MLPDLFDLPRPARGRAASPWTKERLRHLRRRWKAGARGARDRCRVGGQRERGDRKDPSPRHCPPVALRRRARAAARAAKDSGRGSAAPRAPARLLVAPGAAGGGSPQEQTLCRERVPRRADPVVPAPRLVRAERCELQMAGRRSALAVVLLLRGGGDAQQALLRRALYAGLSAPAGAASRSVRSRASGNPGVTDCSPWAPACAGANGVSR